jgi:murein DD-endopeptidase MepM/ murein hydrolase activator NlpD
MIDHGNGYQSLYAHMSSVSVSCGQSVGQGQSIGSAGSTGFSTGSHLHFEIRYLGGFVNPWLVLPAP